MSPTRQQNGGSEPLLATFGLITDIQYADVDDGTNFDGTRQRFYRQSLALTREAVSHWRTHQPQPKFLLQLGDLVDFKCTLQQDSHGAMRRVLDELEALHDVPVMHIWGNHDMYNFKVSEKVQTRFYSDF